MYGVITLYMCLLFCTCNRNYIRLTFSFDNDCMNLILKKGPILTSVGSLLRLLMLAILWPKSGAHKEKERPICITTVYFTTT